MTYEMGSKIVNERRVEMYNFSTLITHQNPVKSNVSVYVGPEDREQDKFNNIYQIDYRHWDIEEDSCGTYELVLHLVLYNAYKM